MAKRAYDITFAVLFLIIFSPVFLCTALIIKIVSPGPVFFHAERIGRDGKKFTCYKFRSMRVDSGKVHITTLRNDDRIFPFGKFIRKSKIDEMPQVINILLGQMSVVGPRPEDKDNADKIYTGEYQKILTVKPGLTSPGSLYDYTHGENYENEEDYIREFLPQKLDLELYYAEHRNFFYDFLLTAKTGAYIVLIACGKESFAPPKELEKTRHTVHQSETIPDIVS